MTSTSDLAVPPTSSNATSSFLIPLASVKNDYRLSSTASQRKIIVSSLYPSSESRIRSNIWQPPPNSNEKCPVLETKNMQQPFEMAYFTQDAPQARHFHMIGTEIYTVLEGEMRIQVDNVDQVLQAGDSVVVLPRSVHYVHPSGSFLCQVICVNCGGPSDKFVIPEGQEESPVPQTERIVRSNKRCLCVGVSAVDIVGRAKDQVISKNSNIGSISLSFGGVARNTAEGLHRLGSDVSLFSIVADDVFGKLLLDDLKSMGMNVDHVVILDNGTGSTHPVINGNLNDQEFHSSNITSSATHLSTCLYHATLGDNGDMIVAISDMRLFEDESSFPLDQLLALIDDYDFIYCDCNLSSGTFKSLLSRANQKNKFVWVDPTSVEKAERILEADGLMKGITCISPNLIEAQHLFKKIHPDSPLPDSLELLAESFLQWVEIMVITCGADGVCVAQRGEPTFKKSPIYVEPKSIINVREI